MLHLTIAITGSHPDALALILETILEAVAEGSREGEGSVVTGESEPDPGFDADDDDLPSEDENDDLPESATRAPDPSQEDGRETNNGGTLL